MYHLLCHFVAAQSIRREARPRPGLLQDAYVGDQFILPCTDRRASAEGDIRPRLRQEAGGKDE